MTPTLPLQRVAASVAICVAATLAPVPQHSFADETTEATNAANAAERPPYENKSLRGRVHWTSEAINKRFGIQTTPDAKQRSLVLETHDGRLYPIIEDVRGQSFRTDSRLRDIDVEILARQFDGSPMIQVVRIFEIEAKADNKPAAVQRKYELDYWCDICAIAMFELKPCDCCQGPIELRRRLMKDGK